MKVIAIDPGTKTGLACFIFGELTDLTTSDFWGCIDHLQIHNDAAVIIEVPINKHVHHGQESDSTAVKHRTGVNVGSVCREAELLCKWLERNNRDHIVRTPLSRKNGNKIDKQEFTRITGWTKRTNQHERDAAMIGWKYRNMRQS